MRAKNKNQEKILTNIAYKCETSKKDVFLLQISKNIYI